MDHRQRIRQDHIGYIKINTSINLIAVHFHTKCKLSEYRLLRVIFCLTFYRCSQRWIYFLAHHSIKQKNEKLLLKCGTVLPSLVDKYTTLLTSYSRLHGVRQLQLQHRKCLSGMQEMKCVIIFDQSLFYLNKGQFK